MLGSVVPLRRGSKSKSSSRAHGPHPTWIFDSLTLDSSFPAAPLAEFPKWHCGRAAAARRRLCFCKDHFASAKITSHLQRSLRIPHHSLTRQQLTDFPVCCIAVYTTDILEGEYWSRRKYSEQYILRRVLRGSSQSIGADLHPSLTIAFVRVSPPI